MKEISDPTQASPRGSGIHKLLSLTFRIFLPPISVMWEPLAMANGMQPDATWASGENGGNGEAWLSMGLPRGHAPNSHLLAGSRGSGIHNELSSRLIYKGTGVTRCQPPVLRLGQIFPQWLPPALEASFVRNRKKLRLVMELMIFSNSTLLREGRVLLDLYLRDCLHVLGVSIHFHGQN